MPRNKVGTTEDRATSETNIENISSGSKYDSKFTRSDVNMSDSDIFKTFMRKVGSSAKPLVACVAGSFIVCSPHWGPIYYIIGAVFNAIFSKILKSIFRVPRPVKSPKPGFGMPSSHAQTLFFFLTVLTEVLLASSISIFKIDYIHAWEWPLRYAGVLCVVFYGVLASLWRVKANMHSLEQTAVGAAVGTTAGYIVHKYQSKGMFLLLTTLDPWLVRLPNVVAEDLAHAVPVPWVLRFFIISVGAVVLYHKQLRRIVLFASQGTTR